ncbi:MAG: tyrosine-protein phosphatase [Cyclobacteriaceae bacterium]
MFSFFKKPKPAAQYPFTTDIHSHLLAGLDDGVKSWEEAERVITDFLEMGFQRIITTPHIMNDTYRNDPIGIQAKLAELKQFLLEKKINVEVQAAAEYYLDEVFYAKIINKEPLLTFGQRYLLFETNFLSEPFQLKDFIFQATTQGYRLVLAHPERYSYMTMAKAEDLRNRGVLFQLNTLSVIGFYSSPIQKLARQFIDKGWVDLLGSDCHSVIQAEALKKATLNKNVQKAFELPLLNDTLFSI